jgi:hypothetical protein
MSHGLCFFAPLGQSSIFPLDFTIYFPLSALVLVKLSLEVFVGQWFSIRDGGFSIYQVMSLPGVGSKNQVVVRKS